MTLPAKDQTAEYALRAPRVLQAFLTFFGEATREQTTSAT
jgi:hypothetical protein